MNKLCEAKNPGQLTRDFNILPSVDHIRDLIGQDAEKIADRIKKDLIDKINKRQGYSYSTIKISTMYMKLVTQHLQKWANLHNYSISITYDGVRIKPNHNTVKAKRRWTRCPECNGKLSLGQKLMMRIPILFAAWVAAIWIPILINTLILLPITLLVTLFFNSFIILTIND